ncbi:MAG: TIR domain-containing protein [Actinomycetota bacterium]
MATRTFISFRGEDEFKVWTLRGLAQFKNVSFEMDDVSLRKEIESRDDAYIRSIIRPKIRACQICLCLVGENTHRSRKWIPWEINLAAEERKEIIAMRFNDTPSAETPAVLQQHGVVPFNWDIDRLFRKLGG